MKYECIRVINKENIAFIKLYRPKKSNAKNAKMLTEMIDALQVIAGDDRIKALVLQGSGKNFSIGLEGKVFIDKSATEIMSFLMLNSRMEKLFASFPKGTVVAVHGLAVMGGAVLAALGDITIMAEDARIGFTAINYGLSCMVAINYLSRIVGQKKALELILTGQLLHANEAERIGLVSKVVSHDKLLEEATQSAKLLASKSPMAVAFTKQANYEVQNMGVSAAVRFLNEHTALLAIDEQTQNSINRSING